MDPCVRRVESGMDRQLMVDGVDKIYWGSVQRKGNVLRFLSNPSQQDVQSLSNREHMHDHTNRRGAARSLPTTRHGRIARLHVRFEELCLAHSCAISLAIAPQSCRLRHLLDEQEAMASRARRLYAHSSSISRKQAEQLKDTCMQSPDDNARNTILVAA